MAGETIIHITGNLTNDPELRFTPSGKAVANWTIASTPKTFDRQKNEFVDGETLFLRCSAWGDLAENIAESLTKGMRVMVEGKLKSRSYETKEGEKRTVIEVAAEEVAPSLRWASAKVTRTTRSNNGGGYSGGGAGGGTNSGPASNPPQDDPWATPNSQANAGGWGNSPDSEPPF